MKKTKSTIEERRHTLAHLLAAAVLKKYPDAKLGIGPTIEHGFYYDFDLEGKLKEEELEELEQTMRDLISEELEMTGEKVTPAEARKLFADQPYKLELVDEYEKEGRELTAYTVGDFTDLCRGGHAKNTNEIDPGSFTLTTIAGAYWRGNENNPQLQRIYALAFDTPGELAEYRAMLEEAKKRDHKKLGAELDLFFIDEEVGKGLPMWTPKGTAIKFELEKFTRELEQKYGYEHVSTPYLGSEKLYRKSGHLDHYAASMYAPIDMDGDVFYLRPMACPHHIRMLLRKPISYRDLPIRYAEIADYNRYEKSGELMGMIRTRYFELTDGHLFVRPDQLKEEFKQVCRMIEEGMSKLGLESIVTYRFSKRDPTNKEKYYPDDSFWNHAEGVMKEALEDIGLEYVEAENEAAFYGPKLDVQAKNVNGKEDTLFTAQIDFLLPEKFDITYVDADGSRKRPVMIHRSTIGSLVRVFAFLTEHYGGAFPFWLAPVQIKILTINDKVVEYANGVAEKLKMHNVRFEFDARNESIGKKIREAELEKIPYLFVVGEKEAAVGKINLRSRGTKETENITLEDFFEKRA